MATRDEATRVIKQYLDHEKCEVGHHLHIWSTPPFKNANSCGVDEKWIGSIQSELADDIFNKKMKSLHDAIEINYGVKPTSHRAGRWGIDKRTLLWLERNNYLVDSSVCPYISWTHLKGRNEYVKIDTYYAPNTPYYRDSENLIRKATKEKNSIKVLEVPVTDFKGDFLSNINHKEVDTLRLILNKLWYNGVGNMSFRPLHRKVPLKVFRRLTRTIFQKDISVLNFMFHSSELTLGTSPPSNNKELLETVRRKIEFVLKTAKEYGIKGITLSEVSTHFNP